MADHLHLDETPSIQTILCHDQIASLCQRDRDWVKSMLIHRQGMSESANMTAFALHQVVGPSQTFRCSTNQGLLPVETENFIDPDEQLDQHTSSCLPPHTLMLAQWDTDAVVCGGVENILGDNVTLKVATSEQKLNIPIIEANQEALMHYGAMLFEDGDCLRFNTIHYPVWKMNLGQHYVDDFLMTDKGKGFYLEWHHDRPHWHQPSTPDAGGFYLLGKRLGEIGDGRQLLQLTGFRIPFGKAVYTAPGALHCDAALTGKNWVVGFTDSEDFSTAVIRNRDGAMLRLAQG